LPGTIVDEDGLLWIRLFYLENDLIMRAFIRERMRQWNCWRSKLLFCWNVPSSIPISMKKAAKARQWKKYAY
jgi:hypothetical protein